MPDNEIQFAMRTVMCDCYFSRNGVDYNITSIVDNTAFENPERKHLTRSASATNTTGLVYTEGVKDPKNVTITAVGISLEMAKMLAEMYAKEERTDFKIIDRKTGRMRSFEKSIISQEPTQSQTGEGAEELNVSFILETFVVKDK